MPLFYDHQLEEEIIIEKQTSELTNWIDHLEFVTIEIDYLYKLKHKNNIAKSLSLDLLSKKENIEYLLSLLYDFRNRIENILECIDIACELHYKHQHEVFRQEYIGFIRTYRALKVDFFKVII